MVPDDAWAAKRTNNFYALAHQARKLLGEKKWEEVKVPLNKLIELYPEQTGADSAYALLAEAHRGLNETNQEREVLSKLASRDADALNAYLRLMELSSTTADWPAVVLNAERYIAVNPLVPQPFRYLARASEALDHKPAAIDAYTTLLQLDPPDPAEVHFRLARLQHQAGDPAAGRHVLQALEEAPRFRDAHRLLLEISAASSNANTNAAPAPAQPTKP